MFGNESSPPSKNYNSWDVPKNLLCTFTKELSTIILILQNFVEISWYDFRIIAFTTISLECTIYIKCVVKQKEKWIIHRYHQTLLSSIVL